MPHHAWSVEGVRQGLGNTCVFDHMEDATFRQDDAGMFSFHAWMANPDLLSRAKTITFFVERAGRSRVSDGPPPLSAPLPTPPQGMEVALHIHLDHYYVSYEPYS
jgi:hypothetical protein